MAHVNGVLKIERIDQCAKIIGVCVQVVAIPGLA
jgi:hypothetical protein